MTQVILMRHGKVDGPAALYGATDVPVLAREDSALLKELINHKSSISQIVSSPLLRCKTLAHRFSSLANIPLHIEENFAEISFGLLDGVPFETLDETSTPKQWQALTQFWQNPYSNPLPESESLAQFRQRVLLGWQSLQQKFTHQNVLLICHGGVIRMLIAQALKLDWQNPALFSQLNIKNGSVSVIKNHHDIDTIAEPDEKTIHCVDGISLPLSALSSVITQENLLPDVTT